MTLGKKVRLRRLFNSTSGNILVVALDHAIGWGVLPGIDEIHKTMEQIVEAQPDAITMMKGTAEKVFAPYAGTIPFIMKATSFSPYQPAYDTAVATVDEAVRLGADAIAIGTTVCGDSQPELLSQLGEFSRQAALAGLPTVTHIYPKGNLIPKEDRYKEEYVKYAARVGAELGIDIIKTFYTGDRESFARVVQATPAYVVISGGPKLPSDRDVFQMLYDGMQAGAKGMTFGRNIWQVDDPVRMVAAMKHIIHKGGSVEEAVEIAEAK
ncbi:MAG: 2-amino-3,7-dideoxy-D-threo-hept-6-ulosonate synthase [Phycisphaerae bacterium]|nr:2-amino-3,7-dideoxy-D-threo-hept-6-ulosonate synthase [Phycisphaerae bacterium]